MKHPLMTLSIALVISSMLQPHVSAQEKNEAATNQWQKFTNLPEEKRIIFNNGLAKAQNLYSQKRIFDTLEKIAEIEKTFTNHPVVTSLKGACYVELRAFPQAKAIFTKSLELSPNNTSLLFNLAEIEFVSNNWSNADKQFSALIKSLPNANNDLIRLCEFKVLLSKIKLGQIKEATAIKDKYDKWDDSPFYYYSRAMLFAHAGETAKAIKILKDCLEIWDNPAALASWQDAVQEYGTKAPSITQ